MGLNEILWQNMLLWSYFFKKSQTFAKVYKLENLKEKIIDAGFYPCVVTKFFACDGQFCVEEALKTVEFSKFLKKPVKMLGLIKMCILHIRCVVYWLQTKTSVDKMHGLHDLPTQFFYTGTMALK